MFSRTSIMWSNDVEVQIKENGWAQFIELSREVNHAARAANRGWVWNLTHEDLASPVNESARSVSSCAEAHSRTYCFW